MATHPHYPDEEQPGRTHGVPEVGPTPTPDQAEGTADEEVPAMAGPGPTPGSAEGDLETINEDVKDKERAR